MGSEKCLSRVWRQVSNCPDSRRIHKTLFCSLLKHRFILNYKLDFFIQGMKQQFFSWRGALKLKLVWFFCVQIVIVLHRQKAADVSYQVCLHHQFCAKYWFFLYFKISIWTLLFLNRFVVFELNDLVYCLGVLRPRERQKGKRFGNALTVDSQVSIKNGSRDKPLS